MARSGCGAALVACLLACAATSALASGLAGPQHPGCLAASAALHRCQAARGGEQLQADCCMPFRFLADAGCFWCAPVCLRCVSSLLEAPPPDKARAGAQR